MSAFSNKTVLITGATGLMGSHIASFLLKENNVKIAALSRNKEKLERIYKEYIKAGRVKIIAQDASKPINVILDALIIFFMLQVLFQERL